MCFLFGCREAEGADLFAKLEVFAVGKGGEVGTVKVEFAVAVDERFVDVYMENIGEKHIMRAEGDDLGDAALKREGGLSDEGASNLRRGFGSKMASLEFIDLSSGIDAAIVDGADHIGGGKVDDELAAFLDKGVGIAFGTNGDIGFWGDGIGDARPSDGEDIGMIHSSAGDEDGGDGGDECAAAPGLFGHGDFLFVVFI